MACRRETAECDCEKIAFDCADRPSSKLCEIVCHAESLIRPLLVAYRPIPPPTHSVDACLWKRQYHLGDVWSHCVWVSRAVRLFKEQRSWWIDDISENDLDLLLVAGLFHDIGKGGDLQFRFSSKAGHERIGLDILAERRPFLVPPESRGDPQGFSRALGSLESGEKELALWLVMVHSLFGFLGGAVFEDRGDRPIPDYMSLSESRDFVSVLSQRDVCELRDRALDTLEPRLRPHGWPDPPICSERTVLFYLFDRFLLLLEYCAALVGEEMLVRWRSERRRCLRLAICMNAMDAKGVWPVWIEGEAHLLEEESTMKSDNVCCGGSYSDLMLMMKPSPVLDYVTFRKNLYESLGYDTRYRAVRERLVQWDDLR